MCLTSVSDVYTAVLSLKVTCNGMALLPLLFQNAIANCNAMLTHSINFQCYQARGKAGSQCYLSHVTNHGSNRGWFSPPSGARNKCSVLKLRLPSAQAPFTSLTTWHVRHSSSMADSSNAPQSAPICLTSASAFGAIVYGGMRFAFFVFRFFLYEVVATVGFGEGSRAWGSMLATFNPVCVVLTTS